MKIMKTIKFLIYATGSVSIILALMSLIISFIYGLSSNNMYLIGFSLFFLIIFLTLSVYFIIKNKITVIKNPNKLTFYNYKNELITVCLGKEYIGEGYSGMTDGVQVRGELTEFDMQLDSAIIWCDRLDMPCAVKLRSLIEQ